MDAARPTGDVPGSTQTLGPFAVTTDDASVALFAKATGAPTGAGDSTVPATFPITWLAQPAIRAALEALARPGEVAFHEDQSFDYVAPLVRDARYGLRVELSRAESPARITAVSHVENGGDACMTMRTVLRLLDTSGAVAASAHAS